MPLVSGKTVSVSGITAEAVTTAKEGIIRGYLIIKAENLEAAAQIAQQCPQIANDGNVEVREIFCLNGYKATKGPLFGSDAFNIYADWT